jgi:hypothetical protein
MICLQRKAQSDTVEIADPWPRIDRETCHVRSPSANHSTETFEKAVKSTRDHSVCPTEWGALQQACHVLRMRCRMRRMGWLARETLAISFLFLLRWAGLWLSPCYLNFGFLWCDRLCGLVARVPGYTTEMYCASLRYKLNLYMLVEESDRLCGLVVRVLGYRSGGPGSIPGTTRKKSGGSGTGSTQLREYNWGATW